MRKPGKRGNWEKKKKKEVNGINAMSIFFFRSFAFFPGFSSPRLPHKFSSQMSQG